MNVTESSVGYLLAFLLFLIIASAYFSSSETSMMSINRYRLKHLKRSGHAGANRVSKLLAAPDKLIGVILIGNNFVNLLAASIATTIAIELFGNPETVLTTIFLTLTILIFAEVTPKTIAALYPEKIAFPSSYFLLILLKLLYPLVWMVNRVSNRLIRLLGFKPVAHDAHQLSTDELRTVLHESGESIPEEGQGMLLNILDLNMVTVNDILVPRNDIVGIDIEDDVSEILTQISNGQHTRMPIYKGSIDNIIGVLHMRDLGKLINISPLTRAEILQQCDEPYYIPESTPLTTQLMNFKESKERLAFIVDEYGVIQGVVTLEDILEEIVGEFTTDIADNSRDIHPQEDGSYLIDGSTGIREINRILNWQLDTSGAKTINGLLVEKLEAIPESQTGIQLGGYYAEVIQVQDNMIRTVRMWQSLKRKTIN